jgi:uncharacterized protein (DUF983 family)
MSTEQPGDSFAARAPLGPCPSCGASDWTDQGADLFIRDRVRCRQCGEDYRREDLERR